MKYVPIYDGRERVTERMLTSCAEKGLEPLLAHKDSGFMIATMNSEIVKKLELQKERISPPNTINEIRLLMSDWEITRSYDPLKLYSISAVLATNLVALGVTASANVYRTFKKMESRLNKTAPSVIDRDESTISEDVQSPYATNINDPFSRPDLWSFCVKQKGTERKSLTATVETVEHLLQHQKKGILLDDGIKLACWKVLLSGRTARRLEYDSIGNLFIVKCPYDKPLVDFVGAIPSASWDKEKRVWTLKGTEWSINHLHNMIEHFFFSVSPDANRILTTTVKNMNNGNITVRKTKNGCNALFEFAYCYETIHELKTMGARWDNKIRKWRLSFDTESGIKIIAFAQKYNFTMSDKLKTEDAL